MFGWKVLPTPPLPHHTHALNTAGSDVLSSYTHAEDVITQYLS